MRSEQRRIAVLILFVLGAWAAAETTTIDPFGPLSGRALAIRK